jgi:hypothetical protein
VNAYLLTIVQILSGFLLPCGAVALIMGAIDSDTWAAQLGRVAASMVVEAFNIACIRLNRRPDDA